MSKHTHLGDAVMGMITTVTLGSWLFQVFSVFVLAIIGVGYLLNLSNHNSRNY
jgi:hypothetical protein